MAVMKKIRTLAGTRRAPQGAIAVPVDTADLTAAVVQLQETLNEVVTRHNAAQDAHHAGAHKVTGATVAATDLFADVD